MSHLDFRRARSDEQREERRRAILATAAGMLAEMPVAELSLNALSRRVCLAKSNVLRYFESREAILLELLDGATREWIDRVRGDLRAAPAGEVESVARVLAGSLADSPLLCELISVSASVLERNVSAAVAARHKRATMANGAALAALISERLPGLSEDGAVNFTVCAYLVTGAAWPHTHPGVAMLQAYAQDPELAAMRMDFQTALREALATLLAGCLARWPVGPTVGSQASSTRTGGLSASR